jgi:hypothetical protein
MNGKLTIEPATRRIIMDRTFAKCYRDTMSDEYTHLQRIRADYPNSAVVRRRIKKNTHQEHYAGLTYAYMEEYIRTHESEATVNAVLDEFKELKVIAKCHSRSRRYSPIKKWFLEKYPAIEDFGKDKAATANSDTTDDSGYETVLPPLANSDPPATAA